MSDEIRPQCAATTKLGAPCKNRAQVDKIYCYTHRGFAPPTAVVEEEPPTAVVEEDLPLAVEDEEAAPPPPPVEAPTDTGPLHQLIGELDGLVQELKSSFPETDGDLLYSPLRLMTMMRDNLGKLPGEMQSGLLENFEGMSKEDLIDPETWKGIAYMVGHSAKFQAGQAIDKVDSRLPEPLQRESIFNRLKENFDRYAPEIAKEIAANFEDATPQDLVDPDTWKGLFYMLEYSFRFQADQLKQRLMGEEEEV